MTAGAFRDKSAGGHQFAYFAAFALGTGGVLLAEYDGLELMTAAFASVFEYGHFRYSLRSVIMTGLGTRHPGLNSSNYNDLFLKIKVIDPTRAILADRPAILY